MPVTLWLLVMALIGGGLLPALATAPLYLAWLTTNVVGQPSLGRGLKRRNEMKTNANGYPDWISRKVLPLALAAGVVGSAGKHLQERTHEQG